jgi:hypothetical protein
VAQRLRSGCGPLGRRNGATGQRSDKKRRAKVMSDE